MQMENQLPGEVGRSLVWLSDQKFSCHQHQTPTHKRLSCVTKLVIDGKKNQVVHWGMCKCNFAADNRLTSVDLRYRFGDYSAAPQKITSRVEQQLLSKRHAFCTTDMMFRAWSQRSRMRCQCDIQCFLFAIVYKRHLPSNNSNSSSNSCCCSVACSSNL